MKWFHFWLGVFELILFFVCFTCWLEEGRALDGFVSLAFLRLAGLDIWIFFTW